MTHTYPTLNYKGRDVHDYGILCRDSEDILRTRMVRASQIVHAYGVIGQPIPDGLDEILTKGCRYSYQDFDVLSSALDKLREFGIQITGEVTQ